MLLTMAIERMFRIPRLRDTVKQSTARRSVVKVHDGGTDTRDDGVSREELPQWTIRCCDSSGARYAAC